MQYLFNQLYNTLKVNTNVKSANFILKNKIINMFNFNKYIVSEPKNYEKKIVFRTDVFELVLISWEKNTKTNIHLHPKNGCLMKVLDGKLIEEKHFQSNINNYILCKNDINYINSYSKHSLKALEKSYTLHLYSPPNYYNDKN